MPTWASAVASIYGCVFFCMMLIIVYLCTDLSEMTMDDEKNRKLSAKEQRRLEVFEKTCEALVGQGYKRNDLTISIVKANLFVMLLAIPVIAIGVLLFIWKNPIALLRPTSTGSLLFIILFLVLIVAHELIHGLTWSVFAEHHFKDIDFGFMKEYLTPYCTCATPLTKRHYIWGALMPCIVLGIIPAVLGILLGSGLLFWIGIFMTLSAGGDIMIVWKVMRYKKQEGSEEILIYDHPTQAGSVIFEK
jgi:hypothetical protein